MGVGEELSEYPIALDCVFDLMALSTGILSGGVEVSRLRVGYQKLFFLFGS